MWKKRMPLRLRKKEREMEIDKNREILKVQRGIWRERWTWRLKEKDREIERDSRDMERDTEGKVERDK